MEQRQQWSSVLIELRSLLQAMITSSDIAKYQHPGSIDRLMQSNDEVRVAARDAIDKIESELYKFGQVDDLSISDSRPEASRMEQPPDFQEPTSTSNENPTDATVGQADGALSALGLHNGTPCSQSSPAEANTTGKKKKYRSVPKTHDSEPSSEEEPSAATASEVHK